MQKNTFTISLVSVNRANFGAPENVTMRVTDANQQEVAKITYDFDEHVEGQATVQVQTTALAPCDPIMFQAHALVALYARQTEDHEFVAGVFANQETGESDQVVTFEI